MSKRLESHKQYLRQNGEFTFYVLQYATYSVSRRHQYAVYGMTSRQKSRKVKMAKVLITHVTQRAVKGWLILPRFGGHEDKVVLSSSTYGRF